MPPRIAIALRSGLISGLFLTVFAAGLSPLAGQELELLRVYPGSGPYVCAAPSEGALPSPDEQAAAGQLASDANQAMTLGDFERVEALLGQAADLDPSSADIAYRRARVLQDLERVESNQHIPIRCSA